MNLSVSTLSLKLSGVSIDPESPCNRPLTWPPADDWVVTEDDQGNPRSLYKDKCWDYSAWKGKSAKLHFTKTRGKSKNLGSGNERILKCSTVWLTHGPFGARTWDTLNNRFGVVRKIVGLCDEEGILASDLRRFPRVLDRLSGLFKNKRDRKILLLLLDRLLRAKDELGFVLVDQRGIAQLAADVPHLDDDGTEQTAYIPPRIWKYQLERLRECLDDFLVHKRQLTECFNFCLDAYAHNFGSLEAALDSKDNNINPFGRSAETVSRTGKRYYGPFEITAQRFEIDDLLRKWVKTSEETELGIRALGTYFSLIRFAGHAYIANFTLQRCEETAKLRSDCLRWDADPDLGRIAIICGETTKTAPDSDDRWPTSPSVEVAVEAMTVVAKLRGSCAAVSPNVTCDTYDIENPFLFFGAFEPWSSTPGTEEIGTRVNVPSYRAVVTRYPLLFDAELLKITEEDLRVALMFTPELSKKGQVKVGNIWPFSWHQLRRTGSVNMFASGVLSDSSIQVIMKHMTLFQTNYYGKNFSRLRFSEEFEQISTAARYEVLARQFQDLVNDRYVSPLGEQRKSEIIVRLVPLPEFKALVKAGQNGEIAFRETRLGGCARAGYCEYGGIESVTKCAGGDGNGPCNDALFDRDKRAAVSRELRGVKAKIADAKPGSPRKRALEHEAKALRNYLNAIRK